MKITEEQELLLSAWLQFCYINSKGERVGILKVVEDIQDYLETQGLIDEKGKPTKKVVES